MLRIRNECLVMALVILSGNIYGQGTITGSIVGHDGDALPFANALLLSAADSSMLKGVVTADNGIFSFANVKSGRFLVLGTMIGFKKNYSPLIEHHELTETQVGQIVMQEESTLLGEVTVKAEKPLFEQQIDRLVVNIQNSITSAGNTILEVLQKSPGVVVNRQNGTISMNGKSGVRVMMNERSCNFRSMPLFKCWTG